MLWRIRLSDCGVLIRIPNGMRPWSTGRYGRYPVAKRQICAEPVHEHVSLMRHGRCSQMDGKRYDNMLEAVSLLHGLAMGRFTLVSMPKRIQNANEHFRVGL